VRIGIVVPYSWSFWGGVIEHADHQARSLIELGHDARILCGNDPPGTFTRVLHPRTGRHEPPPDYVMPIGRSVIVPANGSLPNIILSPRAVARLRRIFATDRFDVLHLHEPMTPVVGAGTLAMARAPLVGTFHASGALGWLRLAKPAWGFLLDRFDHRIAVSEQARVSAARWFPGNYEIVPNGVLLPEAAEPGGRDDTVVFVGRHEPRKGLHVLLRAWPTVHRRTGVRLRLIGADPLAVRLLMTRAHLSHEGVDVLGIVDEARLTHELLRAKALAAPSVGGESFGMVLTRAFACGAPAVASDIPGYREVLTTATGVAVPPGDPEALAAALIALLEDEAARTRLGAAARELARERYAWPDIARRLEAIYERVAGTVVATTPTAAAA
jgi:phosphatidyl-myo-inositol alpha-mannosyltransferase